MCGIVASIVFGRLKLEQSRASLNTDDIKHRGPDGVGTFVSNCSRVFLGHSRLEIVGLGSQGVQPMFDETGKISIVFNGEIYNFRALRRKLINLGASFKSDTDTEVIIQAYKTWGIEFIKKLKGMFAFVIFDERTSRVIAARDRVGIKPLFLKITEEGIDFCSEVDPLAKKHGYQDISVKSLANFLKYRYVPDDCTIWSDILKFPAGEIWSICLNTGTTSKIKYWNLPDIASNGPRLKKQTRELHQEIKATIERKITEHYAADVPVGVLLSGGLDSSCIAVELFKRRYEVLPYSMGFGSVRNETDDAEKLASKYGYNIKKLIYHPSELVNSIANLGKIYGNPLADSSAVPYFELMKRISGVHKVVIGGDGGDELFGGYKWYKAHQVIDFLDIISKNHQKFIPSLGITNLKKLKIAKRLEGQARADYLHGCPFNDAEIIKLFDIGETEITANGYYTDLPPHVRHRVYDITNFTQNSILYKVDVASMRHGVEVRVPFLDSDLLELTMQLSTQDVCQIYSNKKILRNTYKNDIVRQGYLKPKSGFSLPLKRWQYHLRDLARNLLKDSLIIDSGLINADRYREMLLHPGSLSITQLWTILVLESWFERRF